MRRTALAGTLIAALLIFGFTVVGRAGANGIGSASFQATTTATGTGPEVTETALVTTTALQTTTADTTATTGATTGTTTTAGATDTGTTATAGVTDTGTTATAAATTDTGATTGAVTAEATTVTPGELPSTGAGDNGLITLLSLAALVVLGLAVATLLLGRRSAQRS